MTMSIAGRCRRTGMFGIAITSSSPAVAARCAHARTGAGAVCSQNITDPRLGTLGLECLAGGASAEETIAKLVDHAGEAAVYRQLTAIGSDGRTAAFSGAHALGRHAHATRDDVVAAGNMLASTAIPDIMVRAFAKDASLDLAERLLLALEAALEAGGEEGPLHSAGLHVVDEQPWPLIDLRVDWSEQPIASLRNLWALWEPQMHDYVTRALNPATSPSYGVPGDP